GWAGVGPTRGRPGEGGHRFFAHTRKRRWQPGRAGPRGLRRAGGRWRSQTTEAHPPATPDAPTVGRRSDHSDRGLGWLGSLLLPRSKKRTGLGAHLLIAKVASRAEPTDWPSIPNAAGDYERHYRRRRSAARSR